MRRRASGCGEFRSRPASSAAPRCGAIEGRWRRAEAPAADLAEAMPGGEFLQFALQEKPGVGRSFQKLRLADLPKHCESRCAHQRIAIESAALVAMFEAGSRFRRQQCRQRHAAADALAERHDVGFDFGVLVVEELSGAPHAGLDLIEDEQQAVLWVNVRNWRRN